MSVRRVTRRATLGRWLAALVTLAAGLAIPRVDRAEEAQVPPSIQAELLVKVAAYDRNFVARAGSRAIVIIALKPGDDDSARLGAAMQKALAGLSTIAGLPHDEVVLNAGDAGSIVAAAKARRAAIVYVSSGYSEEEAAAMSKAFDGVDVLTVASVARYVPRGVVLGFDLVSGKPKLLVHLGQARRQNVAFGAEILKLMQVYE